MNGTSARWAIVTAAVLLAVTAHASDCTAARRDIRPCRATNRRLYEELQSSADEDGDDGYADTDTDGGRDEEVSGEETAAASDDDYSRPPTVGGDTPRRGVRRLPQPAPKMVQYEKNFAGPSSAGPRKGPRALNNALLNGETVELPTYVNVPVTIRCRFMPLQDGADDKFETVVEAMYPGHADAPPPPPDSHASHILRQLMGSVDGWRGVINKSTRPVRRVIETRFGWPRAWSLDGGDPLENDARSDELRFDEGRGRQGRRPNAEDVAGRQIAARRLAAEHHPWFRGSRPNAPRLVDPRRWFAERRPASVREQYDDHRRTANELIEVSERVDDRQQDERYRQAGRVDAAVPDEQIEQHREAEGAEEQDVDGGETDQERVNDRRLADGRIAENGAVDYSRPAVNRATGEERAEDRDSSSGTVDEVPSDEPEQPAATTESGIATSAMSDYAMITRTVPIKTFTEDAITDLYE